ncbi:MAG: deoxynucleoside kinase [Thiohalophilus sp.]|uniref:deoxynucleoside kinase n=1 Tax=Thiohalophilus sp. TaxID=3028392 RepID=UPI00287033CC|nr:deoxynucleoside kinase [Thiohalophilus sp.]MDR9435677.1 deoxynucleoside kinase [Thiohalophilus sp.]
MRDSGSLGYIVVEGPIGVGKTTLARRLAGSFGSDLILEGADENPFLERFYDNPRGVALQTQLFFLFQRVRQIQELQQSDMFAPVRVADFLMEKDRLFAELTLDAEEFKLYDQVYQHMAVSGPQPDLVVYLQAPVEVLRKRIAERGRPYERSLDPNYLHRLSESYMAFFHDYNASPLLIVNAAEIDFANKAQDYELLLEQISKIRSGRHYFNPGPLEL